MGIAMVSLVEKILEVGLIALAILVALGFAAFWLWMLLDAARNCPSKDYQNIIWVLIIILAWPVGAIIYYFVQRPKNPPSGPAAGPPPGA
jgi:hypothetical protein